MMICSFIKLVKLKRTAQSFLITYRNNKKFQIHPRAFFYNSWEFTRNSYSTEMKAIYYFHTSGMQQIHILLTVLYDKLFTSSTLILWNFLNVLQKNAHMHIHLTHILHNQRHRSYMFWGRSTSNVDYIKILIESL